MGSAFHTLARAARPKARALGLLFVLLAAASPVAASGESAEVPAAEQEAEAPDALAAAEAELLANIDTRHAELRQLETALRDSEGEDRRGLEVVVAQKWLDLMEQTDELAENLLEQEQDGRDAGALRARVERELAGITPFLDRVARDKTRQLDRDRAALEKAKGDEKAAIESRISLGEAWIVGVFEALVKHALLMEKIGADSSAMRENLARELGTSADTAVGRLGLARFELEQVQESLRRNPGDSALVSQLAGVEAKRDAIAENLGFVVSLMRKLELETSEYQQLLIEATGEITTDVLDTTVAIGLFERWSSEVGERIRQSGPQLLFKSLIFVLILGVFRLIAVAVRRIVRRAVSASRVNISQLLQDTAISISSKIVMAIGILFALSQMGLEIGPLLAGIGVAGFIIGFALQDTLGNFASGAMILVYRPYDVDDMIECAGGVYGRVARMSLVSTTILSIDNQTLVVPNSKIWGDVIKNVTAQRMRRVDMTFSVAYDEDIDRAEALLRDILDKHEKVLDEPESMVALHKLGESSVDFIVRPWVETEDYWEVYWNVTRAVKTRFDQEGIQIPFPQRDVHLHTAPPAGNRPAKARRPEERPTRPPRSGQDAPDDDD